MIEVPTMSDFTGIGVIPDGSKILIFCKLLEKHGLGG
jgi:hypothetical protein